MIERTSIGAAPPKDSKGSEALPPPVADKGKAQEASEKEQCKRRRSNATIEQAGLIGKPFGRARRRELLCIEEKQR